MYGEPSYENRNSRPLSFLPSPRNSGHEQEQDAGLQSSSAGSDPSLSFTTRPPLVKAMSNERERKSPPANGHPYSRTGRSGSFGHDGGSISPISMGVRSPSDTANSSFPLNDLDYESDPAAVAQELSNLQALRRMSMDVNAAGDPDLPAFNSGFSIPTVAPTGDADEDDTSRLFWVPARLHPELAPKEFKTFLDSRVDSIKRRSGDGSLSADGPDRKGSGGGLRRKKSMLSRQIDNSGGRGADGYQDGAERLERKKSLSSQEVLKTGMSNLQELEILVNDPAKVIQRLSLDTDLHATGGEVPAGEDKPILPTVPPSNSLRRSTRTTYRRGSLRKSDRAPFSKRAAKSAETDPEDTSSPSTPVSASESLDLAKIQTEPVALVEKTSENFSRPQRQNRGRGSESSSSFDNTYNSKHSLDGKDRVPPEPHPVPRHFVSQIASNGRSTVQPPPNLISKSIPQIVETPPPQDQTRSNSHLASKVHIPERVSSHEPSQPMNQPGPVPSGPHTLRGGTRPVLARPNEKGNQTLREMAAHPSPLPGNSTRTDSLSFIPTLTEDKKADVKKVASKAKDPNEGARKSSWSWGSLLGTEEKEREKRKEEEARDARKIKSNKITKPPDKSHDNTRLDVLQTTMEGSRARESIVLDRADLKLEEERKKESTRKSSGGESKKEKESSLFSSIFGGGKKKGERELYGKKTSSRALSPEPPPRILKPDLDYNWTRFSILEERAIYRMAHIKLANPRRALYSQVLLSNFMYSYLAKVQQMHPQIQIPQTAAQKAQQRHQQHQQQQHQQQHKKSEQPEEFSQYQRYQEVSSRPSTSNYSTHPS